MRAFESPARANNRLTQGLVDTPINLVLCVDSMSRKSMFSCRLTWYMIHIFMMHTVIYGVYIRFWPTLFVTQHPSPLRTTHSHCLCPGNLVLRGGLDAATPLAKQVVTHTVSSPLHHSPPVPQALPLPTPGSEAGDSPWGTIRQGSTGRGGGSARP